MTRLAVHAVDALLRASWLRPARSRWPSLRRNLSVWPSPRSAPSRRQDCRR